MEVLHHPDTELPLPTSSPAELAENLINRVDVLLVTTRTVEWEAAFRKLTPLEGENTILKVHPNKDSYMLGTFGVYGAALVQSDIGSRKTQNVVSEALMLLKPIVTIMVGIGFGLKPGEQRIGDVMVSQSLATYDLQKVEEDTTTDLGVIPEGGRHLSPLFKDADTHNWRFGNSEIHRGLLLSGSKLVQNAEFAEDLKSRYGAAMGGEVEGEGLYSACYANGQQWIIVKGISYFPSSKMVAEAPRFASAAATSLVLHVLSEDNLKALKRAGTREETWTPQGSPVFISYDPGFNKKQNKVVDGIQNGLSKRGIQSHVSNYANPSKSYSTANVDRAVFVALVDHEFYLKSVPCMEELRRALDSNREEVIPLLLSPGSEYPSSPDQIKALFGGDWRSEWPSNWTPQEYLRVVFRTESLASSLKWRVYEDPSFGATSLVDDVGTCMKRIGVQNVPQKKTNESTPSIWRILNPIKDCNPSGVNEAVVDIHQADFIKIVKILTSSTTTPVSIAGLKAAGGVGKTYLARRIATSQAVREYFAPEGVLWSEFGEEDSNAEPALTRIYRDLGGKEPLCFDEDDMKQLAKATISFKELLTKRQPTALLVLDDIWKKKYLTLFKEVVQDTSVKVLVTTRFKGIVEEVFGQKDSVIDLNIFLSKEDAFKLMNKYAGLGSTQEESVSTMTTLASHFGYHAKALAIVSARFKRFKTWDKLLSSVERSKLNLNGTKQAKEWVYAAVEHTLAFALKDTDTPDLKEFFLQLGIPVEGARLSINDLCLLWSCETFDATAIANALYECSVLEADEFPKYDEHAVYYMHDLVRDCARQFPGTQRREVQFVEACREAFYKKPERVSGYVFMHLSKHLPLDDALKDNIRSVLSSASGWGRFSSKWRNTEFIVLAACYAPPPDGAAAVASSAADLCKKPGFFERTIDLRAALNLRGSQWMQYSDVFSMFVDALKMNCRFTQLRYLYLESNAIGSKDASKIVNALKENPACVLEKLDLRFNNIGAAGAESLAKWLEAKSTLTELYIDRNAIGDQGATAIGDAMKVNKTLKKLHLGENNIGNAGAISLAKCLQDNSSLVELGLRHNDSISIDGKYALAPYRYRVNWW